MKKNKRKFYSFLLFSLFNLFLTFLALPSLGKTEIRKMYLQQLSSYKCSGNYEYVNSIINSNLTNKDYYEIYPLLRKHCNKINFLDYSNYSIK